MRIADTTSYIVDGNLLACVRTHCVRYDRTSEARHTSHEINISWLVSLSLGCVWRRWLSIQLISVSVIQDAQCVRRTGFVVDIFAIVLLPASESMERFPLRSDGRVRIDAINLRQKKPVQGGENL